MRTRINRGDKRNDDQAGVETIYKSALETQETEISCQECYDLLDEYTDLIIEGAAPCR